MTKPDTSVEAVELAATAYEMVGRPGLAALIRQLRKELTEATERADKAELTIKTNMEVAKHICLQQAALATELDAKLTEAQEKQENLINFAFRHQERAARGEDKPLSARGILDAFNAAQEK